MPSPAPTETTAVTDRIARSRIQLMLEEPYLASAIVRYPLIDATSLDWCETFATDGHNIFYSADFAEALSEPELRFTLAHEVLHNVLGHLDRRGDRDPEPWNFAIDYATNGILSDLGFQRPKGTLYAKDYLGKTAEAIYDSFPSRSRKQPNHKKAPLPEGKQGRSDEHLDPSDPRGAEVRREDFPTEGERRRLRESLQKDLRQKLHGLHPGRYSEELAAARRPKVRWEDFFTRFISGIRRNDYRLYPPNRRHIWRGIYLPSTGAPGPHLLTVAIDTSGSMDNDTLAQVLAEVEKVRSTSECRLTILQCDAKVQRVDEFDEHESPDFQRFRLHGFGGTSFVPVFEWIHQRQRSHHYQPDALIYLTDSFGIHSLWPPPYPVLWAMTKENYQSPPFGEVVVVET